MGMDELGLFVLGLGCAVGLVSANYESKGLFLLGCCMTGYGIGVLLGVNW